MDRISENLTNSRFSKFWLKTRFFENFDQYQYFQKFVPSIFENLHHSRDLTIRDFFKILTKIEIYETLDQNPYFS